MKFEWDNKKRLDNIKKHGFDFIDAPEIFNAPVLILPDNRFDYNEQRLNGIGLLKNTIVVMTYTEKVEEEITIRIISIRRANKKERSEYEKAIAD